MPRQTQGRGSGGAGGLAGEEERPPLGKTFQLLRPVESRAGYSQQRALAFVDHSLAFVFSVLILFISTPYWFICFVLLWVSVKKTVTESNPPRLEV